MSSTSINALRRLATAIDSAVLAGAGTQVAASTWAVLGPVLSGFSHTAQVARAEQALCSALRWCAGADERLVVICLALVLRLGTMGGDVRLISLSQDGACVTAQLADDRDPVSPQAFDAWVGALSYDLFGERWQGRLLDTPAVAEAPEAAA